MGVKRYLLDSNALNSCTNRKLPVADRVRDAIRRGCRIGTCEPVVAEILSGQDFARLGTQISNACVKVLS